MTTVATRPPTAIAPSTPPAPGPVTGSPRPLTGPRRLLRRPARGLWWVSPAGSLMLVVPLSLAVALRISDPDYRLFYKVPKAITTPQAELFLLAAGVLALGTLLAQVLRPTRLRADWPGLNAAQVQMLRRGETVCFWLTVAGYAAFGALGLARGGSPGLLLRAIVNQSNYTGQLKTIFAPVTGVTSLTQVGVAYVVLAAVLLCHQPSRRVKRRLMIVLLLGLLRTYFLTERLALLELVVPLLAVGLLRRRQRPHKGAWLPIAPVLALPLLLVVFGAFEYSRSWVFYRSRTTLSFPAFVVNRLAGYYATSYNNGALTLQYGHSAGRLPYDSIQGFWTSPGLSQLNLYPRLTGQGGPDALSTVLAQHGNPEFNNPGGLSVPIFDFGTLGGLAFFLIVGLIIGLAHRAFRAGQPVGLLVYPVLFTGLLELPRYLYWTQGRVVPGMLALLVVGIAMVRVSRPRLVRPGRWRR